MGLQVPFAPNLILSNLIIYCIQLFLYIETLTNKVV